MIHVSLTVQQGSMIRKRKKEHKYPCRDEYNLMGHALLFETRDNNNNALREKGMFEVATSDERT